MTTPRSGIFGSDDWSRRFLRRAARAADCCQQNAADAGATDELRSPCVAAAQVARRVLPYCAEGVPRKLPMETCHRASKYLKEAAPSETATHAILYWKGNCRTIRALSDPPSALETRRSLGLLPNSPPWPQCQCHCDTGRWLASPDLGPVGPRRCSGARRPARRPKPRPPSAWAGGDGPFRYARHCGCGRMLVLR